MRKKQKAKNKQTNKNQVERSRSKVEKTGLASSEQQKSLRERKEARSVQVSLKDMIHKLYLTRS